jgi:Na+/H+-dicarboxylate symporter
MTYCQKSNLIIKRYKAFYYHFSASGSAAFSLCSEVNEKELGIDPTLTRIGYPIGSSIYSVCIAVLYVMTAYTTGEIYGIGGNIGWMLTLWIVCTVVSFAVPPVTGGSMACVGILIKQLGFPGEAMAVAGLLSLILDFVATGFSLGLCHLELLLQADRLDMLDHEVLKK